MDFKNLSGQRNPTKQLSLFSVTVPFLVLDYLVNVHYYTKLCREENTDSFIMHLLRAYYVPGTGEGIGNKWTSRNLLSWEKQRDAYKYNAEYLVCRALESCLNQSWEARESHPEKSMFK